MFVYPTFGLTQQTGPSLQGADRRVLLYFSYGIPLFFHLTARAVVGVSPPADFTPLTKNGGAPSALPEVPVWRRARLALGMGREAAAGRR